MTQCPNAETLAAWVEGRLPEAERTALIEHVSACQDCIQMIDGANETFHAEAGGATVTAFPRSPRWLLAAAAVLAVVLATVLIVRPWRRDPVQALVAAAPRSARSVEARLSGGFAWAPYHGSMRASGAPSDMGQMKFIGKAAEAIERAQRDPSPDAQRAAALALVLIEQPDDAIGRLAAQAKRTSSNATAWSDLAAAQYAAALAGRASLYPEALASADRALRIDPRLPEALFNRALLMERLGIHGEARAAWQRYLDVDPSSPWAAEARQHFAHLSAERGIPPFESDRGQFEAAAATGDAAATRALVDRQRERARAFGEGEYLSRWAEALTEGKTADAARWLTVSRNVGAALVSLSGESLLHDAVQSIDSADAAQRLRVAQAQVTYRRGRVEFSRRELAAGERDLRAAAEQFAAAGDPLSLAARSYAAGARLAQNDAVTARRELSALLNEVDATPRYISLAGQVRWELARGLMFDDDWPGAARRLAEAEALFGRAGETVNQAMVRVMLGDALIALGRPDEGWIVHARAFAALTAAARSDLLAQTIGGVATAALRAGRTETARALVGLGESLVRGLSNDQLLADVLVRKSLLDAPGDAGAAAASAREAAVVAMRIADPALRARHLADADVALAAALLGSDARQARDVASRAVAVYSANELTALLAEPYLVRARASLRLGDTAGAKRDLDAGIAAAGRHPVSVAGTNVLDARTALFQEAIRLDLGRGDLASAFQHEERLRGAAAVSPTAVDELRARLAGSHAAVLALVVLPSEVVSLTITERGAAAARHAVDRDALAALAARDDVAAATSLYDLLIRPAAPALADARALIVVPDELLARVPFAALRDGERLLVERMPVSIAASALSLQARDAVRPATLATIALSPAAGAAPLPEVELELAEIGRLYGGLRSGTATTIEQSAAGADVLHIAGHTAEATAGEESLANADGGVSWRTIAAMHSMPPLVVLSACNTLRRPPESDRRALSLAGAFLAAGARDVVGTLAPIGDADARSLFLAFHQQLARGVTPPAALRNVQLAQLKRPGAAWHRLALLTTTIYRSNEEGLWGN